MYGIDIFENINMPIDWYMVYWGIKNGVLRVDVAQDYVCRKIEQDETVSDEESELSWKSEDRISVLETIEKIPNFFNDIENNIEKAKEKVRIAIIIFVRQTEKDSTKLFEQIDMIYADFDYPEDMEKFISYMPMSGEYNPKEHSVEGNREYLQSQLDAYISVQVKKFQLQWKN
ncbi:MAG: DUF2247 family protein [Clostridiales bacterium]|nr:DUF2247 family protein [Clostridiales bacterium]